MLCATAVLWLQGFLALFSGDTGEIRSEVREQIDAKVGRLPAACSTVGLSGNLWHKTLNKRISPQLGHPASGLRDVVTDSGLQVLQSC